MASTIAAYPNSGISPSKKNWVRELVRQLDLPSQVNSCAMQAVLDCICFVLFLIALFMVPA
jgi:hypothetical protein